MFVLDLFPGSEKYTFGKDNIENVCNVMTDKFVTIQRTRSKSEGCKFLE